MSLTYKDDPAQSLNRYLEKLASRNVDLKQIKIFYFVTRGEKMVGVLYGSFETTALARKSIDELPEVLKANQPIPRTVRGIKKDIQAEMTSMINPGSYPYNLRKQVILYTKHPSSLISLN